MHPFSLLHMHPDLIRRRLPAEREPPPMCTRGERRWATGACVAVMVAAAGLLVAFHLAV